MKATRQLEMFSECREIEEAARALRTYLLAAGAIGRDKAIKKKEIVACTGFAQRILNHARIYLIKRFFPVGTSGKGWFIVANRHELTLTERREFSRAMSILKSLSDLRVAYEDYHKDPGAPGPSGQLVVPDWFTAAYWKPLLEKSPIKQFGKQQ